MEKKSLAERDGAVIWHPFTQMKTAGQPIPIARGEGVYLYGSDGRRYLDGISSWWVNLHGHGHPYIAERVAAQARLLDQVIFAGFTHEPAVELAERLLKLLPAGFGKVFFSDNGSTAVEAAIKMAFHYWHNLNRPKKLLVAFNGGYHGDTFGAMSAAGRNCFNRPYWEQLFHVERIDPPCRGSEESSLQQLEKIIATGEVAALIFEPLVQAAGGMHLHSVKGLDALLRCCREHHVLTIADEAMTGFGRTGTLFACSQLQEAPDLICLAKSLTAGALPLAATVCKNRIFDAFLGEGLECAFLHGHSYTANPLACSAALASLDLLLTQESRAQQEMISAAHQRFCSRWQGAPFLARCDHLGTLLALDYRQEGSYFHPLRDNLYRFFIDRGLLLRPLGNLLYMMPPYCITEEELAWAHEQIEGSFEELL